MNGETDSHIKEPSLSLKLLKKMKRNEQVNLQAVSEANSTGFSCRGNSLAAVEWKQPIYK